MTTIDDLPHELIPFILRHLDLLDLIKCREISKKWRYFVDRIKLTEFVILDNDINIKYNWFYTNRPINYRFTIESSNLKSSHIFMNQNMLNNLKYLNISYDIDFSLFDLENFNQFERLEQLDILYISVLKNATIKLPKLRVFYVFIIQRDTAEHQLVIDTPNLEFVFCGYGLNLVEFVHATSIKHLEIEQCRGDLPQLPNLEVLQANDIMNLDRNVLQKLPSLKQLSMNGDINLDDYLIIKNFINYLKKQRLVLRRLDLSIFFLGVQLINGLEFDDYSFGKVHWHMHMKNYSLLAPTLSYFESVNYTELLNLVDKIPDDYHTRFCNIQRVFANKINNPVHFISFLRSCENLCILVVVNSFSLNQEFYDQLPSVGQISELHIKEPIGYELNYEFILRMRQLYNFSLNQELSLDLALKAFSCLKFLKNMSFHFSSTANSMIWIRKTNRTYFLKLWYISFFSIMPRYTNLILSKIALFHTGMAFG